MSEGHLNSAEGFKWGWCRSLLDQKVYFSEMVTFTQLDFEK